jgi:hypothetical protein
MPKYKVGEHVLVKLSGGRLVQATIKAIVDKTEERALAGVIWRRDGADPWQIVIEPS